MNSHSQHAPKRLQRMTEGEVHEFAAAHNLPLDGLVTRSDLARMAGFKSKATLNKASKTGLVNGFPLPSPISRGGGGDRYEAETAIRWVVGYRRWIEANWEPKTLNEGLRQWHQRRAAMKRRRKRPFPKLTIRAVEGEEVAEGVPCSRVLLFDGVRTFSARIYGWPPKGHDFETIGVNDQSLP